MDLSEKINFTFPNTSLVKDIKVSNYVYYLTWNGEVKKGKVTHIYLQGPKKDYSAKNWVKQAGIEEIDYIIIASGDVVKQFSPKYNDAVLAGDMLKAVREAIVNTRRDTKHYESTGRRYKISKRKTRVSIRILNTHCLPKGENCSVKALQSCLQATYKGEAIPRTFKFTHSGDFEMTLINVPKGLPTKVVLRSGHTLVPILKSVCDWFNKTFGYSAKEMRIVQQGILYYTSLM